MRDLGPAQIEIAAQLLADGEVIAVPTDTVYGLGCRLDRPDSLRRLFEIKRRPADVALPVLVASLSMALELVGPLSDRARALMARWWPGPVTFVVPCEQELATLVGASTGSIGLRCPGDSLLLDLLGLSGPLAVTSANLHGSPPATSPEEVRSAFSSTPLVAAVLDGGPRQQPPSSVIEIGPERLTVLRQGAVSVEVLEQFLESEGLED